MAERWPDLVFQVGGVLGLRGRCQVVLGFNEFLLEQVQEFAEVDLALKNTRAVVDAPQNLGSLNASTLAVHVVARTEIKAFPLSLDRSIRQKTVYVRANEPAGILSGRFVKGWVLVSHQFAHADELGYGFSSISGGAAA